jgi:hypothetical protein
MHPDDEKLVLMWVDRTITYEDAIRRAGSRNDVRLGIKLRDKLEPDEDYGPPPSSSASPRNPKRPPGGLTNGADIEDNPD